MCLLAFLDLTGVLGVHFALPGMVEGTFRTAKSTLQTRPICRFAFILANEKALETGERLLSKYRVRLGVSIYIITEWDRRSTCVLPGGILTTRQNAG